MIAAASFGLAPARPTPLGRLRPATRLALLALVLALVLTVPWPVVAALAAAFIAQLRATGLGVRDLWRQASPWLPMAVLALGVHTLTTTSAAPLGHPSWAGVAAGAVALLRLATSLAAMGAYQRSGSLDDLVAGISWWAAPLRRVGLAVDDLGLVVAVACGTVPQVIGEGRRLCVVDDLRRCGPGGARRRGLAWLDRARLVAPLLETLGRRAEALEVALRGRRPATATAGGPRAAEWALLATGLLATVAGVVMGGGAG